MNDCVALGGVGMAGPTNECAEGAFVAPRPNRSARNRIPVLPHHCPRCNLRWGGLKTAHCTACHETFTTVSTFDKHRSGSHAKGTRHCLPPAEVGLVEAGRAYPCWAQAGSYEREDGQ
jgi:hypothetical protein